MGEVEAAFDSDTVRMLYLHYPTFIDFFASVLNTLKALITDEDVFDKEDMSILDRMLEFLKSDDVAHLTAAISLKGNVERIVRSYCFINRLSAQS